VTFKHLDFFITCSQRLCKPRFTCAANTKPAQPKAVQSQPKAQKEKEATKPVTPSASSTDGDLEAQITAQGDVVRKLKADKVIADDDIALAHTADT
jgi:hypothetical protein